MYACMCACVYVNVIDQHWWSDVGCVLHWFTIVLNRMWKYAIITPAKVSSVNPSFYHSPYLFMLIKVFVLKLFSIIVLDDTNEFNRLSLSCSSSLFSSSPSIICEQYNVYVLRFVLVWLCLYVRCDNTPTMPHQFAIFCWNVVYIHLIRHFVIRWYSCLLRNSSSSYTSTRRIIVPE